MVLYRDKLQPRYNYEVKAGKPINRQQIHEITLETCQYNKIVFDHDYDVIQTLKTHYECNELWWFYKSKSGY